MVVCFCCYRWIRPGTGMYRKTVNGLDWGEFCQECKDCERDCAMVLDDSEQAA